MSKLVKAKVLPNSQNFLKITNWYGYNVTLTRKTSDENNKIIFFGYTILSGLCAKGFDTCLINGLVCSFSYLCHFSI